MIKLHQLDKLFSTPSQLNCFRWALVPLALLPCFATATTNRYATTRHDVVRITCACSRVISTQLYVHGTVTHTTERTRTRNIKAERSEVRNTVCNVNVWTSGLGSSEVAGSIRRNDERVTRDHLTLRVSPLVERKIAFPDVAKSKSSTCTELESVIFCLSSCERSIFALGGWKCLLSGGAERCGLHPDISYYARTLAIN